MTNEEVGKEARIQLIGTPDEIAPHLIRVAENCKFQGFKYLAQQIPHKSGQFSKEFQILCGEYVGPVIRWLYDQMDEATQHSTFCIGTITLRSLPNSRTLFTIRKKEPIKLKNAELYFDSYLNLLLGEFMNLGFAHFEEEKPSLGFKLPYKKNDS